MNCLVSPATTAGYHPIFRDYWTAVNWADGNFLLDRALSQGFHSCYGNSVCISNVMVRRYFPQSAQVVSCRIHKCRYVDLLGRHRNMWTGFTSSTSDETVYFLLISAHSPEYHRPWSLQSEGKLFSGTTGSVFNWLCNKLSNTDVSDQM